MAFNKAHDEGVRISVRLTPKSSNNEIIGVRETATGDEALCVKVTSVPERGKANRAMIKLLSKALGVPAGSIDLLSGHTSRHKEILVRGETVAIMAAIKSSIGDATID